jgi:hypothetical protein
MIPFLAKIPVVVSPFGFRSEAIPKISSAQASLLGKINTYAIVPSG